ncbi:hypothetical protein GYMLUDRAFT_55495 [Collybiopsis luxurians FD-317 M1]|nr:hypothetical protein GYMLUDRAFT_55495 [Collybiopsis luxurians FD-317 M1]
MKHFFSLLFLLQVIKVAHSLPSPATAGLSSTLLLNAPGYQNPDNPNEIIAKIESFVHLTKTDYSPFRIALRSLLKEKLHVMDNNLLETAVERTKFFPAIPVPLKQ